MARVGVVKERKKTAFSAKKPVFIALMTAIIAVMSQIAFPLPTGIPVTLQTFAVALCGFYGGFLGVAAVLIYLLLGLVGVPVFANFKGGFYALTGVTGGYLIGFLFFALLCAVPIKTKYPILNAAIKLFLGAVGMTLCHLFGALWFGHVSGSGMEKAFLVCSVPYLWKDIISLVAGYFFAVLLQKRVRVSP